VYKNITYIINKVIEYIKFLLEWIKKFSKTVDLIIAKFVADIQQANARDAQHIRLRGNIEHNAGFGFFTA
jgi:hypothetical protein